MFCLLCFQDSELLLRVVREVFTQTVTRWQMAEFQDVEVCITLLYHLAEALPVSLYRLSCTNLMWITAFWFCDYDSCVSQSPYQNNVF